MLYSFLTGSLTRVYSVLGSTGNVYEVCIGNISSCSCPDFKNGNLCKHIILLLFQKRLSDNQLQKIFSLNSTNAVDKSIQVKAVTYATYSALKSGGNQVSDTVQSDCECAICFEVVDTSKELISYCMTCNLSLHTDCLTRWLRQSKTCVYCRSIWLGSTAGGADTSSSNAIMNEGYINLSAAQGVSAERDITVYHRRKKKKI